jgi:hypothetical protein
VNTYDDFPVSLYGEDNFDGACRSSAEEPEANVFSGSLKPFPESAEVVSTKFESPPVTVTKTDVLLDYVVKYAGCTTNKDALHTRAISRILARNGTFAETIEEAGGYPPLAEVTTDRVDGDGDGIPDAFELQLGTDPTVADSDGVHAASGYTWLEFYLNSAEVLGDWADLYPMPTVTTTTEAGSTTTTSSGSSTATGDSSNTSTPFSTPSGADDGIGAGQASGGDGDDDNSTLILGIVIAAVAVVILVVAVGVFSWRAGRASIRRADQGRPGSTQLRPGSRRRSQKY